LSRTDLINLSRALSSAVYLAERAFMHVCMCIRFTATGDSTAHGGGRDLATTDAPTPCDRLAALLLAPRSLQHPPYTRPAVCSLKAPKLGLGNRKRIRPKRNIQNQFHFYFGPSSKKVKNFSCTYKFKKFNGKFLNLYHCLMRGKAFHFF
jgi:hypothetical protein